jgi:hypothetical protein
MTTTPPPKPSDVLSASEIAQARYYVFSQVNPGHEALGALVDSHEELRRQLAEAEARAKEAEKVMRSNDHLRNYDNRIATLERHLAEAEQERDDLRRHQDTFRVLARLELNHDALEKEASDATEHIKRLVAERDAAVRERDEYSRRVTVMLHGTLERENADLRARLDRAIEALRFVEDVVYNDTYPETPEGAQAVQDMFAEVCRCLAEHDKDKSTNGDRGSAPTAQASAHETEALLVEQSPPGVEEYGNKWPGYGLTPGSATPLAEPAPPKTEAPKMKIELTAMENEQPDEHSQERWVCVDCGGDQIRGIVYPSTPDRAEEYDAECKACGSMSVGPEHEAEKDAANKWWDRNSDEPTRDELIAALRGVVDKLTDTRWNPSGKLAAWVNTPDGRNHACVMEVLDSVRGLLAKLDKEGGK